MVSGAGIALLLIFLGIFAISQPFEYDSELPRPTLATTGLLLLATCVAFWGLTAALRNIQSRQLLMLIIAFAISLRLVALFTCPILEIDYYRYLWDGKALAHGVSPYKYSPAQVIGDHTQKEFAFFDENELKEVDTDSDYEKLVAISVESESNNTILNRIHFSEYSTIYPPVSQAFFGLAMKWVPATISVDAHIVIIKAVLVVFDLLTLVLVLLMLRRLESHVGWSILYAWNPLVIKEIANGGHLDSIATFFLMLSIYFLFKWTCLPHEKKTAKWPVASGVALGLGFGAKLFPVVLVPALVITIARVRWSTALLFGAVFVAVAGLSIYPMYYSVNQDEHGGQTSDVVMSETRNWSDSSLPDKKEGLTSFLSHWRMNDVIFSGIYLNLKHSESDADGPWYVWTSSEFRKELTQFCETRSLGGENPAFRLTRFLTLGLFGLFYAWQLIAIYRKPLCQKPPEAEEQNSIGQGTPTDPIQFERLVWVLAVFLFLQPTVNPWYWVWIAPLTVFSRNRGWLLVAGLLLTYYSRFWFDTFSTFTFAGYSGVGVFDHGIAFIQFAAILVVIGLFRFIEKAVDQN